MTNTCGHHTLWTLLLWSAAMVTTVLGQTQQFFCNFENSENSLCSMQQDTTDSVVTENPLTTYDWVRKSGTTPTVGTGPSSGYQSTYYIYLESSDPRVRNDFARIATPPLNYGGSVCIDFWYHMFGPDVGQLRIFTVNSNNNIINFNTAANVASIEGDKGNTWFQRRQDAVLSSQTMAIGFTGIRGADYRGDIALDNIQVFQGTCSGVVQPTQPPITAPVNLPFTCSFETESICNYNQRTDDNFNWQRTSGSTQTSDTGPGSAQAGTYYLFIEASEPRLPNQRAIIETPQINYEGPACVNFYYHMYGDGIGSLEISTSTRSTVRLLQGQSSQPQQWINLKLDVQLQRNQRIVFTGVRGNNIRGDIAIDNVNIAAGTCQPNLPFTCTFEVDFCGMNQRTNNVQDQFDWTRFTGSTTSEGTGPTGTANSQAGMWYVYTEASDPRQRGDRAYLESPAINYNGQVCLRYWRHMYDASNVNMGELRILTYRPSTGDSSALYTSNTSRPHNNNNWQEMQLTINIQNQDRIVFLGIRGNSIEGDIAIDEVRITQGSCTATPPATPSPPGQGTVMNVYNCAAEGDGSTNGNCRMRQDFGDSMQWTMRSGRTPSGVDDRRINGNRYPITGPEGAASGSNYIYIEASGQQAGMVARLILEGSDMTRGGDNCLRFRYSMNGFHIGQLRVYIRQNNAADRITKWSLLGDQLQGWKSAAVDLNMNGVTEVGLEGVTAGEFSGDIALDDIQMTSGRCEAIPSEFIWRCNFEMSTGAASLCNMDQSQTDNFDWSLWAGMTPSVETGPERAFNGAFYIYIEASLPRQPGNQALIYSPPLTGYTGPACVQFYRHMYGFHTGSLSVHVRRNGQNGNALWTLTGQQGNQWVENRVTVESLLNNDQIVFRGVRGTEYSGDIALDNIRITRGSCPSQG